MIYFLTQHGETSFGSHLGFRFLRTQGCRGKMSGRRFESEQDYFIYISLLLRAICAFMLPFGIFTQKNSNNEHYSIEVLFCSVLFCLLLCV